MSEKTASTTSVIGPSHISPLVSLFAAAFAQEPCTRVVIAEKDHLSSVAGISLQRRIEHFTPLVMARAEAGAEFVEAGGWAAAAIWYVKVP